MNTQEIKEYEYQILMSVNNNFDTKLKEAEVEGWERIGDVLLSKGGAYNQDTIAQIPMRKPIGNKREKPVIEVGNVYKYSDSEIHIFMTKVWRKWIERGWM